MSTSSPLATHRAPETFKRNILLLNIFASLKMALLPMAIITLFWKDQIGLSLSEILILQALFSLATLIMEFPSGYLSDRLGYRFALNLACLFGITGWATYTFAGSFAGVLVAEIQLGISYAFISGADSALLYETLRHEGKEDEYAKHDGRMTAWAQAGEAVGAIGAGALYAWFPLLPFLLQIGVWISALFVCRNLKEIPAAKRHTASHLREALGIARKAFLLKPGLRYSILLAAMLGLASFYPVWLIQPYMQSINVPLVWFGPIWAVANLCVSFGSLLSHRIQYHLGARGTPILLLALIAIGYTGLAFNQLIWGFAFYFLLTIMRGIQGPFLRLALQKQSERHERASILSLKSLTFRLGFVITAPLVGGMADRSGLSFCFMILLITQVLLVAVLIWPFIKNTKTVWNS
ncbi:MAG: MFS transporter [Deltaproteobacteria bacterium]|nr:MAG: MFS transporter [Deltaproteobacteria bacterium]